MSGATPPRYPLRSRRQVQAPQNAETLVLETKEKVDEAALPSPIRSPVPTTSSNAFRTSREYNLEGMLGFKEEPRQILFLFLLVISVAYYSFTHDSDDIAQNVRNGGISAAFIFLVYCFLQTRDGLLVRPHPGVWRIVHGLAVLYLLLMAVLSVQNAKSATAAIRVLFPEVGAATKAASTTPRPPLECELNMMSLHRGVSSIWFLAHVTGWWGKMCMFRDWRFCWVLGIGFELLELIFQCIIPDFQECWWDSLFMDLLGANFLGMCLGRLTLKYLETKEYDWSGKRSEQRGYFSRAISQFTPFSWSRYDWEVFSSAKRFFMVLVALFVCLFSELNAFFLLTTLSIPKDSNLNKYRLAVMFMLGIPAAAEYYEFVTDPKCYRLGQNAWMMCCIIVFEMLVWVKFSEGLEQMTSPPFDVVAPLVTFSVLFSLWMLLYFRKKGPAAAKTLVPLDILFYVSFLPLTYLSKQWAY
ncbi:hypothetical protein H257_08017 [Aphanomyces astaci]|uniref:Phosphatidylserine synthase n=2 Tax=Aphanomyces astaci TaxID=112090 RepID=W4GFP8_APHAT|nr:hypothetical protein H257_08017 [Aphanomyces astaci]ETV78500.1 hypothetical protein H257_08017 [Aphanomyces astaci]|eukprot:XP_009832081.1 hypothetical protein H257_08017 [Aphanomyces astaci]